ncbi:MAG: hypothetical protein LBT70_05110 [Holosporaceae bacterium]|nr:hypothetical protein [Holosporaceae bacterium]
MAILSFTNRNPDEAAKVFLKKVEICKNVDDPVYLHGNITILGSLLTPLKTLENKGLCHYLAPNDLIRIWMYLGVTHHHLGNNNEAVNFLVSINEKSMDAFIQSNEKNYKLENYEKEAIIFAGYKYHNAKNYKKAVEYIEYALGHDNNLSGSQLQTYEKFYPQIYGILAESYEKLKNQGKSIFYAERHRKLNKYLSEKQPKTEMTSTMDAAMVASGREEVQLLYSNLSPTLGIEGQYLFRALQSLVCSPRAITEMLIVLFRFTKDPSQKIALYELFCTPYERHNNSKLLTNKLFLHELLEMIYMSGIALVSSKDHGRAQECLEKLFYLESMSSISDGLEDTLEYGAIPAKWETAALIMLSYSYYKNNQQEKAEQMQAKAQARENWKNESVVNELRATGNQENILEVMEKIMESRIAVGLIKEENSDDDDEDEDEDEKIVNNHLKNITEAHAPSTPIKRKREYEKISSSTEDGIEEQGTPFPSKRKYLDGDLELITTSLTKEKSFDKEEAEEDK